MVSTPSSGEPVPHAAVPILYLDDALVAVHKPTGMPVHRSVRVGRGLALLQVIRDAIGRHVYPVHRLDRPTSGVMVFGVTPEAARGLSEQFRAHRVHKTYLAVVRGWPDASGIVDHALAPSPGAPPQPAVTAFRCLARAEVPVPCGPYASSRYALVELSPRTGRQHQLRRHLKHMAHPIIGDTEYGDGRHNRLFREHFGLRRLLLQAVRLELCQPLTGMVLRLECAPEAEFVGLFPRVGDAGTGSRDPGP